MFHFQVFNPLSEWRNLHDISVLSAPVFWDLGALAKDASEELELIVQASQWHALPHHIAFHAVDRGE